MSKTRELKLPSGYFNPNFLQADRILTSTDLFAAIHHKRANDIKGNWEESLLLVCQKLLNLVREDFPYGVVLQEPHKHPQMARCPNNSVPEILNRIYLGCYKKASDFWKELGAAFTHYLEYYGPES